MSLFPLNGSIPTVRRAAVGLALLAAAAAAVAAQEYDPPGTPTAAGETPLVVRGVTLVDGTGAPARAGFTVVVRDSRIAAVGSDGEVAVPSGARVIDADDLFLIPGLWDLHVHMAKAGSHLLPLFLANGVTGIRDMGGDAEVVAGLRAAVASGEMRGPRIVMAGPIVESDAYMISARQRAVLEPVERFRTPVGTAARAGVIVDSIAALGADFIKLRTMDSLAVYHAIADAADAAELEMVGHAQNIPAEDVLSSGQRSVEHVLFPFLSQRDTAEATALARRFADVGTAFVPTLVTLTRSIFESTHELAAMLADTAGRVDPRRSYLGGFLIDDWAEQLEERIADEAAGDTLPWGELHRMQLADLRLLHAAGAPILPGTDLAVINIFPGSSLHDELELLVEMVELTPMQAIEAATRRAAELVGLGDEVGTIEPGKAADFVLLEADPLADIGNTRRIVTVIADGTLYDRAALDSLRAEVASAAAAIWEGAAASIPTGTYALRANLNGQAFPIRLELIAVDHRPWGRLTVAAGREIVAAVSGVEERAGTWRFAVGGPVRSMQLAFADSVSGTITLGGAPEIPLAGQRTADVAPEELQSHHVLTPLGLAVQTPGEGASFPAATPEGDLIFASHGPDLSHQTLMVSRWTENGPGDPRVLEISGRHSDRSPAVLPDGSAILFASNRPVDSGSAPDGYRLWITSALGRGGWGEPRPVDFEGGWNHDTRQPSVTADGTVYFSSNAPGGRGEGDIYSAAPMGSGRWGPPENLGGSINGPGDEHGAFVAPDGSVMVLTSAGDREGRVGGDDLYVSRRTSDGWSEPIALDLPVNTFANEYGAFVSCRDGLLYFTSDRYGYARVFRVDALALGVPLSGAAPIGVPASRRRPGPCPSVD